MIHMKLLHLGTRTIRNTIWHERKKMLLQEIFNNEKIILVLKIKIHYCCIITKKRKYKHNGQLR